MEKIIYMPILKAKKGEFLAYENLTQNIKEKVIPIFETKDFRYSTDKEVMESQQIEKTLINHIKKYCPINKLGIDLKNNIEHLKKLISINPNIIPTLELSMFQKFEEEFLKERKNVNSFILRIKLPFLLEEEDNLLMLNRIFKSYSSKCNIFLLLDLEEIIDEKHRRGLVLDFKNIITFIKECKPDIKVIISSSSLPKNMDCVENGKFKKVNKLELKLFQKIKEVYKDLYLIYSDYGISQNVDFLDFFPKNTLAKIRYTLEDEYLLLKGRNENAKTKVTKIGYKELLKTLITSKDFMGTEFSDGDKKMATLLYDEKKKGSHGDIIEYGTNHHITVILKQLSQYYEI